MYIDIYVYIYIEREPLTWNVIAEVRPMRQNDEKFVPSAIRQVSSTSSTMEPVPSPPLETKLTAVRHSPGDSGASGGGRCTQRFSRASAAASDCAACQNETAA